MPLYRCVAKTTWYFWLLDVAFSILLLFYSLIKWAVFSWVNKYHMCHQSCTYVPLSYGRKNLVSFFSSYIDSVSIVNKMRSLNMLPTFISVFLLLKLPFFSRKGQREKKNRHHHCGISTTIILSSSLLHVRVELWQLDSDAHILSKKKWIVICLQRLYKLVSHYYNLEIRFLLYR